MENYEEKYKQALKRAKTILELTDNPEEANGYVFTIFPELKEPEDERIRKGLIKGLSAMRDIHKHQTFSDDAININDAIAWLEKQGEQNHSWSAEDEANMDAVWKACGQVYGVKYQSILGDWLKSLKPQNRWKPSEEQMSMLLAILNDSNNITAESVHIALKSLYNDIKKL